MKCGTLDTGEFVEGFCQYPEQIDKWKLNQNSPFKESIYYINGDCIDDRPENMMICHHGCFISLLFSKYGRPPLEIEKKFNIEITMPQICHFCGEEITKKYGQGSDSLCFHSLDEDHENWDPENKVPAHLGCHIPFHKKGKLRPEMRGDKHPMKNPVHRAAVSEGVKESWIKRKKDYGPTGMKDPEAHAKAISEGMIRTGAAKKAWATRRRLYPPNGMKPK